MAGKTEGQGVATWTGGGNGTSYSDPNNWNIGAVPINSGGTLYNVVVPNGQNINFDVAGSIRGQQLGDDWRVHNTWSMLGEALLGELIAVQQGMTANQTEVPNPQDISRLGRDTQEILERSTADLIRLADSIPPIARNLRIRQAIDRLIRFYQIDGSPEQMET